jgi:hypothetical protein
MPEQINRVSGYVVIALSVAALLTVLTGYLPGYVPQQDEGTAAHIFQLSIVALVPAGLLFLATADWTRPSSIARRLSFPAFAMILAFGALYYLEHYR